MAVKKTAFRLQADRLKLKESDVAQQIKGWLRVRRWHVERQQSGFFPVGQNPDGSTRFLRVGTKGKSDYVAWRPLSLEQLAVQLNLNCGQLVRDPNNGNGVAQMFFYETKAPGKRPTPDQAQWMEHRRVEGFLAEWFSSLDSFVEWYARHFQEGA